MNHVLAVLTILVWAAVSNAAYLHDNSSSIANPVGGNPQGVVVYFITSYLIIGPLFRKFYVSQPLVSDLPFLIAYISVGIASAFTAIALTIYPVLKFREAGEEVE